MHSTNGGSLSGSQQAQSPLQPQPHPQQPQQPPQQYWHLVPVGQNHQFFGHHHQCPPEAMTDNATASAAAAPPAQPHLILSHPIAFRSVGPPTQHYQYLNNNNAAATAAVAAGAASTASPDHPPTQSYHPPTQSPYDVSTPQTPQQHKQQLQTQQHSLYTAQQPPLYPPPAAPYPPAAEAQHQSFGPHQQQAHHVLAASAVTQPTDSHSSAAPQPVFPVPQSAAGSGFDIKGSAAGGEIVATSGGAAAVASASSSSASVSSAKQGRASKKRRQDVAAKASPITSGITEKQNLPLICRSKLLGLSQCSKDGLQHSGFCSDCTDRPKEWKFCVPVPTDYHPDPSEFKRVPALSRQGQVYRKQGSDGPIDFIVYSTVDKTKVIICREQSTANTIRARLTPAHPLQTYSFCQHGERMDFSCWRPSSVACTVPAKFDGKVTAKAVGDGWNLSIKALGECDVKCIQVSGYQDHSKEMFHQTIVNTRPPTATEKKSCITFNLPALKPGWIHIRPNKKPTTVPLLVEYVLNGDPLSYVRRIVDVPLPRRTATAPNVPSVSIPASPASTASTSVTSPSSSSSSSSASSASSTPSSVASTPNVASPLNTMTKLSLSGVTINDIENETKLNILTAVEDAVIQIVTTASDVSGNRPVPEISSTIKLWFRWRC